MTHAITGIISHKSYNSRFYILGLKGGLGLIMSIGVINFISKVTKTLFFLFEDIFYNRRTKVTERNTRLPCFTDF